MRWPPTQSRSRVNAAGRMWNCDTSHARIPNGRPSGTRSRCGCRCRISGDALWSALDARCATRCERPRSASAWLRTEAKSCCPTSIACLRDNMRDLGTPVYSQSFFDEVVRAFPDDTRVFIVRIGAEPIAASLTISAGATVSKCHGLRLFGITTDKSPNMLLYWTMLRWAVERGFTTFDFGRSTPDEGRFTSRDNGAPNLHVRLGVPRACGPAARFQPRPIRDIGRPFRLAEAAARRRQFAGPCDHQAHSLTRSWRVR